VLRRHQLLPRLLIACDTAPHQQKLGFELRLLFRAALH
jgi:hypothetical protein